MHNLKLVFVFLLIQGISLSADAVEVKVGDRPINVPVGFVELTPDMSPYCETVQAYIAPTNIRYLTLITED